MGRVALELVLVLVLVLTLVRPTQVAAESPPRASDGRSLVGETPATQALFAAVWGARAAQRWVDEHNAELAGLHAVPDAASAAATSTLPTQTADGAIVTPIA